MVLVSSLSVVKKGARSLKTVVPEGIVEYLDLHPGDKIEWGMSGEWEKDEKGSIIRTAPVRKRVVE